MIKKDPEQRGVNEDKSGTNETHKGGFKAEKAGGFWPSSLLFPAPSYFTPVVFSWL